MAHNAKRMKDHLFGCKAYFNDLTNAQSWIVKSTIHSKIFLAQKETALSVNTTNHFGLIQTQIAVLTL